MTEKVQGFLQPGEHARANRAQDAILTKSPKGREEMTLAVARGLRAARSCSREERRKEKRISMSAWSRTYFVSVSARERKSDAQKAVSIWFGIMLRADVRKIFAAANLRHQESL
jgi:hypothetical protein